MTYSVAGPSALAKDVKNNVDINKSVINFFVHIILM